MTIAEKLYSALIKKYEADIAEAEAEILIYLSNPVGIGEHPQHIEEMDKFVEKLANAKDKLETLQLMVKINPNGN
jgi:methylaspartate ammonia-lyase